MARREHQGLNDDRSIDTTQPRIYPGYVLVSSFGSMESAHSLINVGLLPRAASTIRKSRTSSWIARPHDEYRRYGRPLWYAFGTPPRTAFPSKSGRAFQRAHTAYARESVVGDQDCRLAYIDRPCLSITAHNLSIFVYHGWTFETATRRH